MFDTHFLIEPYIQKGKCSGLRLWWANIPLRWLIWLVQKEWYAVDLGRNVLTPSRKRSPKRVGATLKPASSASGWVSLDRSRFFFANGLLCSMAYRQALKEIKRILKLSGKAYLS